MTNRTLFLAALLLTICTADARSQSLTSSLGWTGFVVGITPVMSTFRAENAPAMTRAVSFSVTRFDGALPDRIRIDDSAANGWAKDFDMGRVQPGAELLVAFLDAQMETIGDTLRQTISTKPRPEWLRTATLTNVKVTGRTVVADAAYPAPEIVDAVVPADVTGLGGRPFSLYGGSANLRFSYDLDSRIATVSRPRFSIGIDMLDQQSRVMNIILRGGTFGLDSNFNLRFSAADTTRSGIFDLDIPSIEVPIDGFAELKLDAGVAVTGYYVLRAVIGNDGDAWGFIRDGDASTRFSATAVGLGRMPGGFRVDWGLATVRGSVVVDARLGAALEYSNVPQVRTASQFGGAMNVSGRLKAKAFWFLPAAQVGPSTFHHTEFGELPGRVIDRRDDGQVIASTALLEDARLMPEESPQHAMSARFGHVGVDWIERRGEETVLWFSSIGSGDAAFSAPQIVRSSRAVSSAPALSMTPTGSAFITWTENRYEPENVPAGSSILDLVRAQDVWIAAHDAQANMIGAPIRIADDIGTATSGRAEAEPRIVSLGENSALVIWMALNAAGNGTDLWYATVSRSGATVSASAPAMIPTESGANRNPVLAPLGDDDAMLAWVHDAADPLVPNRLLSAKWSDGAWASTEVEAQSASNEEIDEVALGIDGEYGVMAWTQRTTDSNGRITQRIETKTRRGSPGEWTSASGFVREDAATFFRTPRIAISPGGHVALTYQVVRRAQDTSRADPGSWHSVVADLASSALSWKNGGGGEELNDSGAFAWEAQSGFADDGKLYFLTEETGTPRRNDAIVFGNRVLGLKLRALRFTEALALAETAEPGGPPSSAPATDEAELLQLMIGRGSTTDEYILEYRVSRGGRVEIELYNIAGRKQSTILARDVVPGTYRTTLDVSALPAGSYVARLATPSGVATRTIGVVR